MVDRKQNCAANTARQLLTEQGHQGFGEGIRLVIDEPMRRERAAARQGQANGFKPKTLITRMGDITFQVPNATPAWRFHPFSLEKGVRRASRRSSSP